MPTGIDYLDANEKLLQERGIELEPLEAEADKPTDSKTEEDKSESEEKETPETEEEKEPEESEKEPKEPEPQKNTVRSRFEHRESKRRKELEELGGKVDTLTALVQQLAQARSPESKEEAKDEIADFAKEQNLDADGLKKLVGIIKSQIKPEEKPPVEEAESYNEAEEAKIFNDEWDAFQVDIEEQFKNSAPSQWKKAKTLMDELSHSEDYHDKDLDYVYFKNKQAFEDILFSPKKKSAETSRLGDAEYADEELDFDKPITNPQEAQKARKQLYDIVEKNSQQVIHRDGHRISLQ